MLSEFRRNLSLPFILPEEANLRVSFEFFPPKTEEMEQTLWESLDLLAPLNPSFFSVTYGAGGSTRARTHEIVTKIQSKTTIPAAAHLTCIHSSKDEIAEIAEHYWNSGIRHIVALRGDPPAIGTARQHPIEDEYRYANELVAALKKIAPFEITVAGYPETHPQADSPEKDLYYLKQKIDAGATRIITQFFINPEVFLRFRDRVAAAGIFVPVVPGILPITNFKRTLDFARICGAKVPGWLQKLFDGLDEQPKTRQLVAATVASEQSRVLHENGVRDFHFYTLNRADLALGICHMLGLRSSDTTKGA
jgi:methylenetetrahydrofolate reductase (NADPH)